MSNKSESRIESSMCRHISMTSTYNQLKRRQNIHKSVKNSDKIIYLTHTWIQIYLMEFSVRFSIRLLTCISIISFAMDNCETVLINLTALFLNILQLKSLRTRVENSRLASFRCCLQLTPSTTKIPFPNKSFDFSCKYWPLVYLLKLDLSMCSMFRASVVNISLWSFARSRKVGCFSATSVKYSYSLLKLNRKLSTVPATGGYFWSLIDFPETIFTSRAKKHMRSSSNTVAKMVKIA